MTPSLPPPFLRADLTQGERQGVLDDLMREVMSLWQTDELRRQKPTPLDGGWVGGSPQRGREEAGEGGEGE